MTTSTREEKNSEEEEQAKGPQFEAWNTLQNKLKNQPGTGRTLSPSTSLAQKSNQHVIFTH
uniref:Uncharacterized protein n=1 Tax=Arundo donax TaxID=35708 RepID=A0A0A9DSQ0_ARUDO